MGSRFNTENTLLDHPQNGQGIFARLALAFADKKSTILAHSFELVLGFCSRNFALEPTGMLD